MFALIKVKGGVSTDRQSLQTLGWCTHLGLCRL